MALLSSSSGKCGGTGGGSPPPVRVLGGGAGGGSGSADPLLPPTLYCPVLPPWHLALLTHHALHARGLSSAAAGGYLPLPPILASMPHPQGFPLPRVSQGLPTTGLPQSPVVSLASGLHRRDLTSTSPAKHGLTSTPPLLPTTPTATPTSRRLAQPPRRSFTIADLLGGGDDLHDDSRAASSSSSPPAGGHDPSLMQEGVGGLFDDLHDHSSALHPQEDFTAVSDPGSRFEWLQCTRYHPPKLPRVKRREGGQKRKLGRNPRVPFSSTQLAALETRFRQSQYLSSCDVADLSALLNLTETRVSIDASPGSCFLVAWPVFCFFLLFCCCFFVCVSVYLWLLFDEYSQSAT
ncbi:homeobox protein MSX-1-like [Eriocheir sinensis]|uniref:homeobox protein MSX-1-like n=1 Tax=Eriocheir sinensis TaxID=95602 RepID=UPI0021C7289D|nr:homeobox protein MSX-1-like [Eriocheir sinensis]